MIIGKLKKMKLMILFLKIKLIFFVLETYAKNEFFTKNVFIEFVKVLYLESLYYQNNNLDNS
jgi:hypothetical protein